MFEKEADSIVERVCEVRITKCYTSGQEFVMSHKDARAAIAAALTAAYEAGRQDATEICTTNKCGDIIKVIIKLIADRRDQNLRIAQDQLDLVVRHVCGDESESLRDLLIARDAASRHNFVAKSLTFVLHEIKVLTAVDVAFKGEK